MTVQHTFKGTQHLDNAVKYVSNLKVSIQKKKNQRHNPCQSPSPFSL